MARGGPALPRWLVLGLIAVSMPMGLGIEQVLQRVVRSPDIDAARAAMGPTLAPVAWALVALTAVTVALGVGLRRWLVARGMARLGARRDDPAARDRVALEALYLATSVPQVPALLATVASLAGAPFVPVVVAAVVSTVGVVALGLDGRSAPKPGG